MVGRFLSNVRVSDKCWTWSGHRNKLGYGKMTFCFSNKPKTVSAHRVAFALAHGRWPEPQCLHRCDNPRCVRPSHLFEGTQADNLADMRAKGRDRGGRKPEPFCKRGHKRNRYPSGPCKDCMRLWRAGRAAGA